MLRVLQEREFRAVGGREPVHVDVRIISASNTDLRRPGLDGALPRRPDVPARTCVPMRLPPLRDRKDDIPLLVDHFMSASAASQLAPT